MRVCPWTPKISNNRQLLKLNGIPRSDSALDPLEGPVEDFQTIFDVLFRMRKGRIIVSIMGHDKTCPQKFLVEFGLKVLQVGQNLFEPNCVHIWDTRVFTDIRKIGSHPLASFQELCPYFVDMLIHGIFSNVLECGVDSRQTEAFTSQG
jgi:hypothetical protein